MRRGALISVPSLPVEFVEGGNATLSPGKEYWITAPTRLTLSRSARAGDRLIVVNNTEAEVTIAGQNLGGVDSSRTAFSGQSAVRLAANGEARLVRSRRGWRVRGCDRGALVFTYNGTPLASNPNNPLGADNLFTYLGLNGGTWTNPANTAILTATGRAAVSWSTDFSILTNRQTTSNSTTQNMVLQGVATSAWVGWRLASGAFNPTGFWLQTQGVNNTYHPRAFTLRVGTTTELLSTTTITSLPSARSWTGQTSITGNGAYFYFPVTTSLAGNSLVLQFTENGSSGEDFNAFQEFALFGSLSIG